MTSTTDALRKEVGEGNDLSFSLKQCMSRVIEYDTQRKQTWRNRVAACFVYEGCLSLTYELLSAFCPGVIFQIGILNILWFAPPPSPRFADSIRGMLKLILVLMLAGASLASTWFTLTCLSRVTHLPSTAGGSTRTSQSRWHWHNSDTTQSCSVHLLRNIF